jgi:GMP synthase-like glutamine amidotransferase
MTQPVAIVQHETSVPPGLIAEVIDEAGIEVLMVHAWDAQGSWPSSKDVSALVVMGGTMNVDELDRYPFLEKSRALMTDAIHDEVPTLGVCLGSQMMARVLGSDVYRSDRRNATFSGMKTTTEGQSDPVMGPFSDGTPVLQFHEDTFSVPPDAVLLATSDSSGLPQAFRFGTTAYAVQFHFEVDRSILKGWIDDIGPGRMRDDWGVSPDGLLEVAGSYLPDQDRAGRELVRGFLTLIDR